ncbi:MAG TPA: hypothetical protein VKR22_13155 [Acidimicrobiales bacterium]|nr:hypothetical protein [Acidimicrobiales bacterium]
MTRSLPLWPGRRPALLGVAAVALALAACSSSNPSAGSSSSNGASNSSSNSSSTKKPSESFSTSNVGGLGSIVVDGQGHAVYILTAGGHTNAPCTDASGCTKVWPDLPLPDGVSAATAGSGLQSSLLGTMKLSDGETYPTYNGWLMYEYTGDTGGGQANGQGIKSFGGTWYVLSASGNPVTSSSSGSGGGSSGGYGNGNGY